ncbi:hypothetical protein AMTRI_Chr06g178090 [Amborella trichopoda]
MGCHRKGFGTMGILVIWWAACLQVNSVHGTIASRKNQAQLGLDAKSPSPTPGMDVVEQPYPYEPNDYFVKIVRVDPLDKFKKYRGDYNFTNPHYWSSTIFTGIPGYAIGAAWFFVGLVYAGFLVYQHYTKRNEKEPKGLPYMCRSHVWSLALGLVLTILIITLSSVVLAANTKFYTRAKVVKNTLVSATEEATKTIYNVTDAIEDMQKQVQADVETESDRDLNSTSEKLKTTASDLRDQAHKNQHLIEKGLRLLFVSTICLVSVNLALVLVLPVFSAIRCRRTFLSVIFICWFLTVLLWLYFGAYYFINKFAEDSCSGLEEFRQHPHNSSLGSVLPCDDLESAEGILLETREGLHGFINQVNKNISMLRRFSSSQGAWHVCNPFTGPPQYHYHPQKCSADAIQIGDIPQLLNRFTSTEHSSGLESGNDQGKKSIYERDMKMAIVYTRSIQSIINAFPNMETLVNCSFLEHTFSTISIDECPPLRRSVRALWSSMACLSTFMVVLLLVWVAIAHQDQREFSHNFIVPHLSPLGSPKLELRGEP